MEYLYQGKLPSEEAIVKELIGYSDMILLKKLKIYCEKTLVSSITKQNMAEFFKISTIAEAEDLKEAVREFTMNNFDFFVEKLAPS